MSTEVGKVAPSRLKRVRRLVVAIASVLTVLSVAGIIVLWQGRRPAPPTPPDVDLADADPAVRLAIESAQAAVRRAPRSADAWGRLGMVLAAHSYYPDSVACFAEAHRLDPGELRWPYYQGVALVLGDPNAAIAQLRRAVEMGRPVPVAARLRLAELLVGQGQAGDADELFRQVLANEPDNPHAHLGLGQLAYQRNDWASSLAHLARSAASPLTVKRARTMLAAVYQRRGDISAAERERRQANDLPADAEMPDPLLEDLERLQVGRQAQLARASTLLKQDQAAEAVALLGKVIQDYPDYASAWLGLGRALIQLERYAPAERALRQAAVLDPDRVEVQFYLGVALFQQGRTADATPYFRRATEMRPDYAVAQYNFGQCLKSEGDLGGAIAALRAAVRFKPHYAQAHTDLGDLLGREGQRELALQHVRLALELDPTDARAKALLEKYQR